MPQQTGNSRPALVADIGGTNARFASIDLASGRWLGDWTGKVAAYEDIIAAVEVVRRELPGAAEAQQVCIAIAGPVIGDHIRPSNNHWLFSHRALHQHFGWSSLLVVNDFLASAYGVAELDPGQYLPVGCPARPARRLPSALMGPGTGLGVAALLPEEEGDSRDWRALATEGGHARFAPTDAEEIAVLQVLQREHGLVQREDILSGSGLCRLYKALATVHGLQLPPQDNPAEISRAAMAEPQSHSFLTLQRFCAILGSVAADVALDLGTRGSLFLTGGILPRMPDFLLASPFRQRFEDHAHFGDYLRDIDTLLVTETRLGLIGAAACLRRQQRKQGLL